MILIELKTLIKERGEICLSELYSLVDSDRGLIDQAIFELLQKGIITEIDTERACKGCPMKCNTQGEKVFRIA
jgi:predicted transcriptional regulator